MDPLDVADAMRKVAQQIPTLALSDADRIAQAAVSLELVTGLRKKADVAIQQGGAGEIPIVPTTSVSAGENPPRHASGLGQIHGSKALKQPIGKPGQPGATVKATSMTSGMPKTAEVQEKEALVGGGLARLGLKAVQALGGKAVRKATTVAAREAGKAGKSPLMAGARTALSGIAQHRPVATAMAGGLGAGYLGGKLSQASVYGIGTLTAANQITKALQGEDES